MKIIFSGGETLGSVMPLVALWQELGQRGVTMEILWLSTRKGVEHLLLSHYQIPARPIITAKLRRYFSWKNFFIPFLLLAGCVQAFFILKKFRPNIVISAGGYVSVPVVWMAKILRIPSFVHQQDIRAGFANILMSWAAAMVTVAFEKSLADFNEKKAIWLGNPVRKELFNASKKEALSFFRLSPSLPVVLIMGGGTGALFLNTLVLESIESLVSFCQVIHIGGFHATDRIAKHPHYRYYALLKGEIRYAYAVSDVAVCRAGLSTLTELAALRKPSLLIPLPQSHQEENAMYFAKNNAAIVLDQSSLTPDNFIQAVRSLMQNEHLRENLSRNMGKIMKQGASETMADLVISIAQGR